MRSVQITEFTDWNNYLILFYFIASFRKIISSEK